MSIKDFNLEKFIESKTNKVKQRVRNKAIKKAENNLIRNGRLQTDLTPEEWESLVYEEEDLIWNNYKKGSITTLIALAFWMP
tara:strand:+ start:446 stop:691 length:246 start_codon:yes stop_codon:yes gene_type:complete